MLLRRVCLCRGMCAHILYLSVVTYVNVLKQAWKESSKTDKVLGLEGVVKGHFHLI